MAPGPNTPIDSKDNWERKLANRNFWVAVVGALIAVVVAGFGIAQFIENRHERRAWVTALPPVVEQCQIGEPIKLRLKFKVGGETRARIKNIRFSGHLVSPTSDVDQLFKNVPEKPADQSSFDMPPGETFDHESWQVVDLAAPVTDEQITKLANGEICLWVAGVVEYEDIYKQTRKTEFCFSSQTLGNPNGKKLKYVNQRNTMD